MKAKRIPTNSMTTRNSGMMFSITAKALRKAFLVFSLSLKNEKANRPKATPYNTIVLTDTSKGKPPQKVAFR